MTLRQFIQNDKTLDYIINTAKFDADHFDYQVKLRFDVLRMATNQWIEKHLTDYVYNKNIYNYIELAEYFKVKAFEQMGISESRMGVVQNVSYDINRATTITIGRNNHYRPHPEIGDEVVINKYNKLPDFLKP